jgi:hypothetical protein
MRYSLLNTVASRRIFDPSQEKDLHELKYFVDNNQWIGNCPFYLEESWDNVPAMCMHKYAQHMLRGLKPTKQKAKSPV